MPQLAAFPKAYLDPLCITGEMSLREWIELASTLEIDGLELYSGILDLADPGRWGEARRIAEDHDLVLPMLCCSPDFTHPDPDFRRRQIDLEKSWIDMAAALGINMPLLFALVFATGVALAAFAGAIAAPISSVFPGMGNQILIICFVVVVIGGIGSINGALIASLAVGLADTLGKVLAAEYSAVAVYLVMALILLWRPQGIANKA